MIAIRATRINASTTSIMMMATGLSLSPPPQSQSPLLLQLHPPQQTVVGGKQSQQSQLPQSQLPPAGPGVGT